MIKNEAGQSISAFLPNKNTGAAVTSGTVTVYVTLDGGIQAEGSGTVVHEGNGVWNYFPTQSETNGDSISFLFTHADAVSVNLQVYTTEIVGVTTTSTQPVAATTTGLNRFRIREEVRRILRDPEFPRKDINMAINSVISTLNRLGRFKFNQTYQDLTLVASQKAYALTGLMGEELLVYEPDTDDEKIIKKAPSMIDPYSKGWFVDTGDSPDYYLVWGNQAWFEPIPNATAAGQTVRVYGWFMLPLFDDDLTATTLHTQYCISVLAWGAAAELAPNMIVESNGKLQTIFDIYTANLKAMKQFEVWEPLVSHKVMRDHRWTSLGSMGHVSKVRG